MKENIYTKFKTDSSVFFWGNHFLESKDDILKPSKVKFKGSCIPTMISVGDSSLLVVSESGLIFSMGVGPSVGHLNTLKFNAQKNLLICHCFSVGSNQQNSSGVKKKKNSKKKNFFFDMNFFF